MLARAYGWTEAEVLALSERRRAAYLALAEQGVAVSDFLSRVAARARRERRRVAQPRLPALFEAAGIRGGAAGSRSSTRRSSSGRRRRRAASCRAGSSRPAGSAIEPPRRAAPRRGRADSARPAATPSPSSTARFRRALAARMTLRHSRGPAPQVRARRLLRRARVRAVSASAAAGAGTHDGNLRSRSRCRHVVAAPPRAGRARRRAPAAADVAHDEPPVRVAHRPARGAREPPGGAAAGAAARSAASREGLSPGRLPARQAERRDELTARHRRGQRRAAQPARQRARQRRRAAGRRDRSPPSRRTRSSSTTPTRRRRSTSSSTATSLNQGWAQRRAAVVRRRTATRVSSPPLALDLHYLLTAYGSADFQAEILLGYAMHLLHERPVLDRAAIRTALDPSPLGASILPPAFQALTAADLADQLEAVTITPEPMDTEEMSRLWSAIQAHYRPTAPYLVSVVLIEARKPSRTPLPVLSRGPVDPTTGKDRGVVVEPSLLPPYPTILARRPARRAAGGAARRDRAARGPSPRRHVGRRALRAPPARRRRTRSTIGASTRPDRHRRRRCRRAARPSRTGPPGVYLVTRLADPARRGRPARVERRRDAARARAAAAADDGRRATRRRGA